MISDGDEEEITTDRCATPAPRPEGASAHFPLSSGGHLTPGLLLTHFKQLRTMTLRKFVYIKKYTGVVQSCGLSTQGSSRRRLMSLKTSLGCLVSLKQCKCVIGIMLVVYAVC